MRRNKENHDFSSQNAWNNFDDEDNNLSEDEMELNFNEFNVKVSANHDDGYHHHQRSRKLKDRKSGGKNKNYYDNEIKVS